MICQKHDVALEFRSHDGGGLGTYYCPKCEDGSQIRAALSTPPLTPETAMSDEKRKPRTAQRQFLEALDRKDWPNASKATAATRVACISAGWTTDSAIHPRLTDRARAVIGAAVKKG